MASKSFPKNTSKTIDDNTSATKTFRNTRRATMTPYKKAKNVGNRVHMFDLDDE